MSSKSSSKKGRRPSHNEGMASRRTVALRVADERIMEALAGEAVPFTDLYQTYMAFPYKYVPADGFVRSTYLNAMAALSLAFWLFVTGMVAFDIAQTTHTANWIDITVYENIKLAEFVISGCFFLGFLLMSWSYSGTSQMEYGQVEYYDDQTEIRAPNAKALAKAWHYLNELVLIWLVVFIMCAVCWGAVFTIWRGSSQANTNLTRWLGGDDGALSEATRLFTGTQQIQTFVLFISWNGPFQLAVWLLVMMRIRDLCLWVQRQTFTVSTVIEQSDHAKVVVVKS